MKTRDRKPLRLWPGVVIAILQLLLLFAVPAVVPDSTLYVVLGGVAGTALIALWWLFFSRAPWVERLGAIVLMAAGLFATKRFVDVSIATGAQGFLLYFLAIRGLGLALVAWAVATQRLSDGIRRLSMAAAILLACGVWTLVRTGGFTASFHNDLHWRWSKTAEERLLAQAPNAPGSLPVRTVAEVPARVPEAKPASQPAAPLPPAEKVAEKPLVAKLGHEPATTVPPQASAETGPYWPGFRGPHRDDVFPGNTDWTASPPAALWRRPIGPGWSSFAVRNGFIYTQEQRGPDEVVACYKLANGDAVWAHRDTARFWESNGGPGPRGTPTLSQGRVYTFGATGIVNALNADDGSVVWSRNAAADTGTKTPQWGFASSPLVVDDMVIVGVAGQIAAYGIRDGAKRWTGPAHGVSYSSPQLVTLDGVRQVLLLSEAGLTSVALDGTLLWEHAWPGYPIVQPAVTADGDILISVTDHSGLRRLGITHGAGGWAVQERWTSNGLKPYFNDFVVHAGYAYGFDGSILSCIDLKDGTRKWKGGRYGNGQLILLSDENLLLVTAEEGDIALVKAAPDEFKELARVPGLEGKTWNHPVLAGDVLLVRNGQEMAAFRLSPAGM